MVHVVMRLTRWSDDGSIEIENGRAFWLICNTTATRRKFDRIAVGVEISRINESEFHLEASKK